MEKGYRMEPPKAALGPSMPSWAAAGRLNHSPAAFRKLAEKLARELRSAGASALNGGQDTDGLALPRSQEP